jgi:hypothetical protein
MLMLVLQCNFSSMPPAQILAIAKEARHVHMERASEYVSSGQKHSTGS